MNYNVRGISDTKEGWAAKVGVSSFAMDYELRRGRSMTDIVQQFQIDTFAARAQPSLFVSDKDTYQLVGKCQICMAKAKDFYDQSHLQHMPSRPSTPKLELPPK